jgi:two-component system, LytTR family, sensor kinase
MLVSAVWIAPAVLATVSMVAQRRLNGEPPASLQELLWAGGDWLVYAVLTPPIFAVSRRWPIARPHIARRAALHLGCALLFCLAWALSGKVLQLILGLLLNRQEVRTFVQTSGGQLWQRLGHDVLNWIFITLPFGVVVYLSIAGIAHAIRYFVEAKEREVQMARLSEQVTGARLAALHAQLNPHFLFNSLNTIAVLVRDGNRATATRVIEQLSEVLRSTLSRTHANEVSLEEELRLVRQYLEVEQARFSDRLRPVFEIDPATLSAAVPRFALQHLVENALRHGIARRTEAGRVVVTARRDAGMLDLSVEDDGAGLTSIAVQGDGPLDSPASALARAGHGLENTRERLQTLYGDRASLVVTAAAAQGTIARLRIPFREIVLEATDDATR